MPIQFFQRHIGPNEEQIEEMLSYLGFSSFNEFINEADKIVEREIPGAKRVTFGHLGDGNIHYNISQPKNMNEAIFLKKEPKLRNKILSLITQMGGSFSAEHGVGIVRKKDALKVKSEEIKIMKKIKKSLDPKNILNPGKIFD